MYSYFGCRRKIVKRYQKFEFLTTHQIFYNISLHICNLDIIFAVTIGLKNIIRTNSLFPSKTKKTSSLCCTPNLIVQKQFCKKGKI